MKILSLLLSLLLAAPFGGLRLTAAATDSEILSAGALTAVNTLLTDAALTLSPAGYDLLLAGEPLLQARVAENSAVLACGDAAAQWPVAAAGSADVWQTLTALGTLLRPWEQRKEQSVDLQEAGTARSQLIYALSGEEWAGVWPQTVELLCRLTPQAAVLADAQISGKGTLKRYFARDGQELGGYFYAASMTVDGVVREVRLEFGYQPDKGLYLAFRCPNEKETENVRIALHAAAKNGGWSLSGDLRIVQAGCSQVWTAEGRTNGQLKLTLSDKKDGRTAAYALTLKLREGEADYTWQYNKHTALQGTAAWQPGALTADEMPAANGETEQVANALAHRLLGYLQKHTEDGGMQLIHYLATDVLLNAQREAERQ